MAAAAGGLRPEGPQPHLRHRRRACRPKRCSWNTATERRRSCARAVPARRRHDLCLRDLKREPAADRPRPMSSPTPARSSGWRRSAATISPALAAAQIFARQACFRPVAADGLPLIGRVPGIAGRLCRHRPQRLGHPQRAGDRRGDGRADRRRRSAHGRSGARSIRRACRPLDPAGLRTQAQV